nr:uncharacterized protein LOC117833586 [Setaria viridis]
MRELWDVAAFCVVPACNALSAASSCTHVATTSSSSSRGDDMGAVAVSREDMEVKKMEAGGELRSEDIGLGVSPGHASFFLLCYAKRRQLTSRQPSLCFLGTS